MRKRKEKRPDFQPTPSVSAVQGQPETVSELINKYGTYEIQPTNDSDNEFPKIQQGLPNPKFRKDD